MEVRETWDDLGFLGPIWAQGQEPYSWLSTWSGTTTVQLAWYVLEVV
jgi:hypothetical protein